MKTNKSLLGNFATLRFAKSPELSRYKPLGMMTRITILSVVTLLSLLGCVSEISEWSDFQTYQAAENMQEQSILNGSARQISFSVDTSYPNRDVVNFYRANIKLPWKPCSRQENWQSFGDISGKEPLFIHQILQHWINKDKSRLLLLAVKYQSKGSEHRKLPDSTEQQVYLVEYKEPELERAIKELGLSCNGL